MANHCARKLALVLGLLGSVCYCRSLSGAENEAPAHPAFDRIVVLPLEVTLWRPGATQTLLVEAQGSDGTWVGDLTPRAQWESSNPDVAIVDEKGVLHGLAPGESTVRARVESWTGTVTVRVLPGPTPYVPSFRHDVIAVLTKFGCNSGACHGAATGKGGLKLSLRGYDVEADYRVLTRQALGRRVDRQEPGRSLLLLKPTATVPHGGGLRFEVGSEPYWVLAEWIAAGCPGPSREEPRLQSLQVLPERVRLRPGDGQRLIVLARYADGRVLDVTPWCKFSTSESVVADVTDDGIVTVRGKGEAAVAASLGNLLAVTWVTVPFQTAVEPSRFAQAERFNFIDELVLAQLQALGIPPSPVSSDHEFIRRAFLDATGTLPTPEEVLAFVQDRSPDKRKRLVRKLLETEAFVDYWTYKLCDLLLVSSEKLPQPALWAFYRWIRQAVADNMPWNEFATRLLTATGSNLENGAANYFILHKDVVGLTETTAVTFLGTSITCARCHNHPLEKWTQDQYYGMANFFARVRLKNGPRGGETVVWELASGDVLHPRKGVPIPPQPLEGLPMPPDYTGTRRAYLAQWLTHPENELFAKAIVNRIWAHYLGRGIAHPEDDLRVTNPPSNAALLDRLAQEFVSHGYNLRWLMDTIMTSATYQRSCEPLPENVVDDRWGSHYLLKRLPAEVLADAQSQVTGVPDEYPGYALGTRAIQLPDVKVASYFLDVFGRPKREQACSCERQEDTSIAQTLHLFNGESLNRKLRTSGGRIDQWLNEKVSIGEAIDRLFLLALSREGKESEKKNLLEHLRADGGELTLASPASREHLEDLFWAVLTSPEFAFNH